MNGEIELNIHLVILFSLRIAMSLAASASLKMQMILSKRTRIYCWNIFPEGNCLIKDQLLFSL